MACIYVPKERRPHEGRVALIPQDAAYLIQKGYGVFIEDGAGILSGYENDAYHNVGAEIVSQKAVWGKAVWGKADRYTKLIVKVKELQPEEMSLVEPDTVIMLFPHFKGDQAQKKFFEKGREYNIVAIPHEELRVNGVSPVLAAMSRCAGEVAAFMGCEHLRTDHGGPGILPSDATIQILGAGNVGWRAMEVLASIVKKIHIHDSAFTTLPQYPNVLPHDSTPEVIGTFIAEAHIVICAAKDANGAPKLITYDLLDRMPKKAFIIDVPIDEGGNCSFSQLTEETIVLPTKNGVRYMGVSNIPGRVPQSSSVLFSKAVRPFAETLLLLTDRGMPPTSARELVAALPHINQR